jgi:hypothetical protein
MMEAFCLFGKVYEKELLLTKADVASFRRCLGDRTEAHEP